MKRQIYSAAIDVQQLNKEIKNNKTTKKISLGNIIACVMGVIGIIGIMYFQNNFKYGYPALRVLFGMIFMTSVVFLIDKKLKI